MWYKDNLDDDEEDEDDGYYDENCDDVMVVVRLLDPRDGIQAGGRAGRQADSESWGNSSSQWVSLPVSQHISLNRPGLQIDPLACNCLEGRGRPADDLMRGTGGKVRREEWKNRVMLTTEKIGKLC